MKDKSIENAVITLYSREQSLRNISRSLGISRNRVSRILQMHNNAREGKELGPGDVEIKRKSKLDSYRARISELLESYPQATCQRVYEELQKEGYQGRRTILGDYLQKIRGRHTEEPVYCVEQGAGQRGSHDWSDYEIQFMETGQKEKVTFFSFILNFSRRQYIEEVPDKKQETLFESLERTFRYMEGIPYEVKSDNQKACVDRWESGHAIFNSSYLDFANHYRFRPLSIHPGKPRENLKIERPFYYFETNFLNSRSFKNREDLREQLREWLQEVNDQHIHRITKRKPIDLWKEEYPYLQGMPEVDYDTRKIGTRIVNNESAIEWEGYFYMVPGKYQHKTCQVMASREEVIINSIEGEEIVRYGKAEKNREDKYVGRTRPESLWKSREMPLEEVIKRLESIGPSVGEFIKGMKEHKKENYKLHLRKVLKLKISYHNEDILLAISRALKHKVYESRAIENFLSLYARKKNDPELFPDKKG